MFAYIIPSLKAFIKKRNYARSILHNRVHRAQERIGGMKRHTLNATELTHPVTVLAGLRLRVQTKLRVVV